MSGKADAITAISKQFKDRTDEVVDAIMAQLGEHNATQVLGPGLAPMVERGSLRAIATVAVYADILRMVRDLVMADGSVSDQEAHGCIDLMSFLARAYAKVRPKHYAPYATLSGQDLSRFFALYEADKGPFGYADGVTKWAGVAVCRHIYDQYSDPRAITLLMDALIDWATKIAAADQVDISEMHVLDEMRRLLDPRGASNESSMDGNVTLCGPADSGEPAGGQILRDLVGENSVSANIPAAQAPSKPEATTESSLWAAAKFIGTAALVAGLLPLVPVLAVAYAIGEAVKIPCPRCHEKKVKCLGRGDGYIDYRCDGCSHQWQQKVATKAESDAMWADLVSRKYERDRRYQGQEEPARQAAKPDPNNGLVRCTLCGGQGVTRWKFGGKLNEQACTSCYGKGWVKRRSAREDANGGLVRCSLCGGQGMKRWTFGGQLHEEVCSSCNGKGWARP